MSVGSADIVDKPWEAGFTLLEVLVAIIILGLSFGAIFQALSQSKRISWKAMEVIEASRIANNILENSMLIDTALKDKGAEGPVDGEKGWDYSISVKPLVLNNEAEDTLEEVPSMFKLHMCLSFHGNAKERSFCFTRWYRR